MTAVAVIGDVPAFLRFFLSSHIHDKLHASLRNTFTTGALVPYHTMSPSPLGRRHHRMCMSVSQVQFDQHASRNLVCRRGDG